jgi:hypothetical protein
MSEEQPRVPAGNPKGGEWTSTKTGVGGGSATVTTQRGDWAEAEVRAATHDPIKATQILTAPEGGIVEVPRNKDPNVGYYDAQKKELADVTARLDPTRVWKVWVNDDTIRARDLGDKTEHDRLMGGPEIRQVSENSQKDWDDPTHLKPWQEEQLLPKNVGGIDRGNLDITASRLVEKRGFTPTPEATKAAALRQVEVSVKEAFQDLPKDWKPGYFPYDKNTPEAKAQYTAEKRAAIEAKIRQVREQYGNPEALLAHMENLVREDLAVTSPGMVMNQKTFGMLLDGQPLKNYLEGVKSSVSSAVKKDTRTGYVMTRTFNVDAQQFGIPITEPGALRPVHGLTVLKDATPAEELRQLQIARQYGGKTPVMITFGDHMKAHSTVTAGDSLDGGRVPVPYDKPTIHAIAFGHIGGGGMEHLGDVTEILDRHVTDGSLFRKRTTRNEGKIYGYDEVQFHRRPTAADIKHVTFVKEPAPGVKKKLTALGIQWSVVSLPEE